MQLVDHDTFLKQLVTLFESSKDQGSIWITHKRLCYDKEDITMKVEDGAEDPHVYPCLLRVSNGDKVKFSTKVDSTDLLKFHQVYGALLKSCMASLRKRDKKREKQRAEEAAARKKKLSEPVVVNGSKRGGGRKGGGKSQGKADFGRSFVIVHVRCPLQSSYILHNQSTRQ
ncbi:signal recognition particle 14 kda [Lentinula edodes]|uniref:Signal recognition particle subunit SRP14 n=1 Tax=Lentinula edodes TaxID=5353 RepID=A0A1Q3E3D4_LENED|nr:signal recognition particle 14 kda [Lentinula edodes]